MQSFQDHSKIMINATLISNKYNKLKLNLHNTKEKESEEIRMTSLQIWVMYLKHKGKHELIL